MDSPPLNWTLQLKSQRIDGFGGRDRMRSVLGGEQDSLNFAYVVRGYSCEVMLHLFIFLIVLLLLGTVELKKKSKVPHAFIEVTVFLTFLWIV